MPRPAPVTTATRPSRPSTLIIGSSLARARRRPHRASGWFRFQTDASIRARQHPQSRRGPVAQLPFVDTHVHFSDLREKQLAYVWLQPEFVHPLLGDLGASQAQRCWADDSVRETRFTSLTKSVHVQAALGIEDPVEETKWLQAFADRLRHPPGLHGGGV